MILRWTDQDGDPIAVLSTAIVAISVGTLNGPSRRLADAGGVTVTLVHLSNGGPLLVAAPFDEVLALWQGARLGRGPHGETLEEMRAAPPGVFPLVVHQHPELLP